MIIIDLKCTKVKNLNWFVNEIEISSSIAALMNFFSHPITIFSATQIISLGYSKRKTIKIQKCNRRKKRAVEIKNEVSIYVKWCGAGASIAQFGIINELVNRVWQVPSSQSSMTASKRSTINFERCRQNRLFYKESNEWDDSNNQAFK